MVSSRCLRSIGNNNVFILPGISPRYEQAVVCVSFENKLMEKEIRLDRSCKLRIVKDKIIAHRHILPSIQLILSEDI